MALDSTTLRALASIGNSLSSGDLGNLSAISPTPSPADNETKDEQFALEQEQGNNQVVQEQKNAITNNSNGVSTSNKIGEASSATSTAPVTTEITFPINPNNTNINQFALAPQPVEAPDTSTANLQPAVTTTTTTAAPSSAITQKAIDDRKISEDAIKTEITRIFKDNGKSYDGKDKTHSQLVADLATAKDLLKGDKEKVTRLYNAIEAAGKKSGIAANYGFTDSLVKNVKGNAPNKDLAMDDAHKAVLKDMKEDKVSTLAVATTATPEPAKAENKPAPKPVPSSDANLPNYLGRTIAAEFKAAGYTYVNEDQVIASLRRNGVSEPGIKQIMAGTTKNGTREGYGIKDSLDRPEKVVNIFTVSQTVDLYLDSLKK
jgi:hypothetical protein